MGIYRIADRVFELRCHYGYTERLCVGYAAVCESPDYILEASESEIMAEAVDDAAKFPPPYLESLALYRKIAESLINDDCFLFHAAVLEFDGKAYAFTAKSGTGKTTHISLWEKVYGDRVRVINGDKPLIRRKTADGSPLFIAYGTPWCGKEHKNTNTSAQLAGICLIERAETNSVSLMEQNAAEALFPQIYIKKDLKYMQKMLGLLDSLVGTVPVYRLRCNMEDEAAKIACRALTGNENN